VLGTRKDPGGETYINQKTPAASQLLFFYAPFFRLKASFCGKMGHKKTPN